MKVDKNKIIYGQHNCYVIVKLKNYLNKVQF